MRFPRSPRAANPSDETRKRDRRMRRALSVLAGAVALVALVAAVALVLLGSLDRPGLKRRVQALVRASAGVDIDYRTARVDVLSGLEIDELVVRSPGEVRTFAPDLIRIGTVHARWSLPSLLLRRGPVVRRLTLSDVTLTVVVDQDGRTSFDALPSSEPSPTVPLSHQASKYLGEAPPVGALDVERVTLALVRTELGQIVDRWELRGVSLALATRSAEPTARGWRADAKLGTPENPLELELAHAGEGTRTGMARARLWMALDATATALTGALDLRMVEQSFAANLAADHWLHAQVQLRFDPLGGKTRVSLEHVEAGDGAATAEAALEIADGGGPIVRSAHGEIDLARLLRWLPDGLVPVTAEQARIRYRVDSLVAGPVVRLADGGAAEVDAELSNVELGGPRGRLRVGAGELSLRAQPSDGGRLAGRGSLKLSEVRIVSNDARLDADDVAVDFDAQQGVDGVFGGGLALRFARIERAGAPSFSAREGRGEIRLRDFHPEPNQPLATRGDISLSLELASLDLHSGGKRAVFDRITLRGHGASGGHAPYAVELEAPVSRLRVTGSDGGLLVDAPARVEAQVRDATPDIDHPYASRGVFHGTIDVGETSASLDATKASDAIDFSLRAAAGSLRALRPFLPPASAGYPLDRMAVSIRSSGHVERLAGGDPAIAQTTELDVEHPGLGHVAAQSISVTLKSKGTARKHTADLDLRVHGLMLEAGSPGDDRVTISASVDRDRPSLQFQVATEGRAIAKVAGALSFDRSQRAVLYEVDGHLSRLAALAPLAASIHGLDGFDLSELALGLAAHGALLGVVAGVSPDGVLSLEPIPARTAAIEGAMDVRVDHVRWTKGDTAIVTPSLAWHGDMHTSGARRTLDSRLELGALHLGVGSRELDINGIRDEARATVAGDLSNPEIELTQRLSVRAVEQAFLPEYPMGDLAFSLSAERGPEGVIHVADMKLVNGLAGTAFALRGNVDLGEGRRTLSVTTSLSQDLARLSTIPERFQGRGKVAVDANLNSPDFVHYHVRAAVKADDVTLALPRAGIDVDTANGEVPVTVALEVGASGVALQRSEKRSPYSMLRFADQHPLLSRSGFFSVKRLKTPFVSIAPLVGNLAIDQNIVSLRQFEMGVRGGSITGQCGLDWEGAKSTVEIHVRATGVQSSHGEPFDGNIAVVISAGDRTIDGRAEILRIGERHLLDLMDLHDPLHVDPAMNRVRTALAFGYPDSLRLVFDHGFASAHLELGGLARLVSIGELRGIPMGPIVDKMIAPMLVGPDTKEAP